MALQGLYARLSRMSKSAKNDLTHTVPAKNLKICISRETVYNIESQMRDVERLVRLEVAKSGRIRRGTGRFPDHRLKPADHFCLTCALITWPTHLKHMNRVIAEAVNDIRQR